MRYYLGLDNGGTSTKAALFAADGREAGVCSVDTAMLTPRPGFVERDMEEMWRANCSVVRISDAVTGIVRQLQVRPAWIIAKGGITSSEIGVKGLGVRRARVMGQALAGVPVWETGEESRFPGLPYVIFPGNVGGPDALYELVSKLRGPEDGRR